MNYHCCLFVGGRKNDEVKVTSDVISIFHSTVVSIFSPSTMMSQVGKKVDEYWCRRRQRKEFQSGRWTLSVLVLE